MTESTTRKVKAVCGDNGGRTQAGDECQTQLRGAQVRCMFHPQNLDGFPEAQAAFRSAMSAAGQEAHRSKRSTRQRTKEDPRFTKAADVIAWCETTAGAVRRGEFRDYKALDAELKVVRLALDALGVQSLDTLGELERMVRARLVGASLSPLTLGAEALPVLNGRARDVESDAVTS